MEKVFEATIEKRGKWYIGWIDAVPGAFAQERTIKEVEESLKEVVRLILETEGELKTEDGPDRVLKRKILVQV